MKKKIIEKFKEYSPVILAVLIFIVIVAVPILWTLSEKGTISLGGRSGGEGEIITTTTNTNRNVIGYVDAVFHSGPAILHRVIIGEDVAGGQIAISDAIRPTTLDNLIFTMSNSTMSGVYEIGSYFNTGILVTITEQSEVMLIYTPK